MEVFYVYYGLGGGFGGARECERVEARDYDHAQDIAYELAAQEYEQYDGLYGLRSVDDIMEEDQVDEDEAYEIWRDERESWLDYEVYTEEEYANLEDC